jgi:hypothetical protein
MRSGMDMESELHEKPIECKSFQYSTHNLISNCENQLLIC